MRRLILVAAIALALAPWANAQPLPGSACAPTTVERAAALSLGPPTAVRADGASQEFTVSWVPPVGASGYRVRIYGDGQVTDYETLQQRCRVGAVNGRLYAVEVAAIDSEGRLGPFSEPVPVRPAFENDFLFLASGLASVWVGVWAYAFLLVRQQRRLVDRYEALFKRTAAGGGP